MFWQAIAHNYEHIQAHLINDAFANAMGWSGAWLAWWFLLIVTMLLANFGGILPSMCNGMHAFPLGTLSFGLLAVFVITSVLVWFRLVRALSSQAVGVVRRSVSEG